MVFQWIMLGPLLRNLFFADAAEAPAAHGFDHVVFADDLNCFRIFDGERGDDHIFTEFRKCQKELHERDGANQVRFEQSKESLHILDRASPVGTSFKILSAVFDGKLPNARGRGPFC